MKNNPFSLMFGKAPYSIIERHEDFQQIVDTFNSNQPATFAYMITGIRGSGKTVMMRRVAEKFSSSKDWIVVDINSQNDIIQDLSEKILYEGNKTKLFLNWSISINAKFFTLQISKDEKINNPEIILERLIRKANEGGKRILVTIDEISSTQNIKRFANFYQSMIGKNYELFLLMTGLKNNINALINSDASSFLSRTPKIELHPLNEIDIAREYEKIFDIDFNKAVELAKLTNGYAFAYQVLGHIFYEREDKEIDEKLLKEYDRYLQTNGYGVIWNDLTAQEKKLCFSIAENDNVNKIMSGSKMAKSNFQNYRKKLIEKEIIKPAGYGKVDFVLPRFKQFVLLMNYFE